MSILNVIVQPERAWVAVDTAGMDGRTGNAIEVSKIVPLAHANLLFAARGAQVVMHNLAAWCMSLEKTADFDLLANFPPGFMDSFHERLMHQCRAQGYEPAVQEAEIAIVGWSENQQRVASLLFRRSQGAAAYEVTHPEQYIAPIFDDDAQKRLGEQTVPSMLEYMRLVAKEQMAWAKRYGQASHMGGRLLLAEVTRIETRIRPVCRLDSDSC